MIHYPLRVEGQAKYLSLVDASDRLVAGGLLREDAEEIVARLNAAPRARAKKPKIADQLRASDLTAQAVGGRADIVYGPHDALPQCGEHVARIRKP